MNKIVTSCIKCKKGLKLWDTMKPQPNGGVMCMECHTGSKDKGSYCKECGMGWYNCLCRHDNDDDH